MQLSNPSCALQAEVPAVEVVAPVTAIRLSAAPGGEVGMVWGGWTGGVWGVGWGGIIFFGGGGLAAVAAAALRALVAQSWSALVLEDCLFCLACVLHPCSHACMCLNDPAGRRSGRPWSRGGSHRRALCRSHACRRPQAEAGKVWAGRTVHIKKQAQALCCRVAFCPVP